MNQLRLNESAEKEKIDSLSDFFKKLDPINFCGESFCLVDQEGEIIHRQLEARRLDNLLKEHGVINLRHQTKVPGSRFRDQLSVFPSYSSQLFSRELEDFITREYWFEKAYICQGKVWIKGTYDNITLSNELELGSTIRGPINTVYEQIRKSEQESRIIQMNFSRE